MSRSQPVAPLLAAVVLLGAVSTAAAQEDWRVVDNPYQEDVEYSIGTTFEPGIMVEGIRWRSFTIETPESGLVLGGETIETEVVVTVENRRTKAARILVILLLEDADGNPLDRIEIRPFKVGGGRLKERTENVEISGSALDSARRAYLFFEIME